MSVVRSSCTDSATWVGNPNFVFVNVGHRSVLADCGEVEGGGRELVEQAMELPGRILMLVVWIGVLGEHIVAQESGGTAAQRAEQLLNQTELNVRGFVKQVESNHRNSCPLLSNCTATSSCSRLSCPQFATRELFSGYECQEVLLNSNCKNNCSRRAFDFSRSFIRVAGLNRYNISDGQLEGICVQRNLDPFFRTVTNNTDFVRLLFGSADGTTRLFPGADEVICGSYDPRTRPWYLTSTKVKKAIMVLIDRGSTMTTTYSATNNDNRLGGAFEITKALLNVTTQDDYVNIFLFDHKTVEPLSERAVRVTDQTTHPEFANFTAHLDAAKQNPTTTVDSASNATNAINVAIANVGSNTDITNDYLKVILVITDGKFVDATRDSPLPWDLIKRNNMNLFVYMYPPSSSTFIPSDFSQPFCEARGYFETLEETASQNPLLALRSFFSFLANIHSSFMGDKIDYSTQFSDQAEVDNQTFTLSKAAFSDNRELLGVVSIGLFKTKLLQVYNIDGDAIEGAVKLRSNPEINFNASRDLNTSTCLNQTRPLCNSSPSYANTVCSSSSEYDITSLSQLSCCGVCKSKDTTPALRKAIGIGVGGGIAALLLLSAVGFLFYRKSKEMKELKKITDANMPNYPESPRRANNEPW